MNEHVFMRNVRDSLIESGTHALIIPDGMDFGARDYDMDICLDGQFIAVEGKFQKSFKAFGMSALRDSQIIGLNRAQKSGGESYVFLNIWIPRQENRLLVFDWGSFKHHNETIGTYKKKELEVYPYLPCKVSRFNAFALKEILRVDL